MKTRPTLTIWLLSAVIFCFSLSSTGFSQNTNSGSAIAWRTLEVDGVKLHDSFFCQATKICENSEACTT